MLLSVKDEFTTAVIIFNEEYLVNNVTLEPTIGVGNTKLSVPVPRTLLLFFFLAKIDSRKRNAS